MMPAIDRFFTALSPVTPFVIGPNAQLGTEATFVFGPLEVTSKQSALRAILCDPWADGFLCPIVGQVMRFSGAVVATTTIRTSIQELATGRTGQNLILGIRAKPSAFLTRGWVLSRAHALLYEFLEQASGDELSGSGASIAIEAIQRSRDLNSLIVGKLPLLLAAFEEAFYPGYTPPSSAMARLRFEWRRSTFLAKRRTFPAMTQQKLKGYWAFVDKRLQEKSLDLIE